MPLKPLLELELELLEEEVLELELVLELLLELEPALEVDEVELALEEAPDCPPQAVRPKMVKVKKRNISFMVRILPIVIAMSRQMYTLSLETMVTDPLEGQRNRVLILLS